MAFMTLKTIVFQNEKKNISTSQFCSFYCLFVTWSRQLKLKDDIIFVKGVFVKLRHGFFTKESKLIFGFCHI